MTARWPSLAAALIAVVSALVVPPLVGAQSSPVSEPPRTPWGAPDLTGLWDFRTATPLERPSVFSNQEVLSEEQAAVYERERIERLERRPLSPGSVHASWWLDFGTQLAGARTSLIVDPPDGRIPPLTPQAERWQAAQTGRRPVRFRQGVDPYPAGPEDLGLSERCMLGYSSGPPITPGAYNNNLMVFQTPDHVVLVTEMVHEVRIVPLDGRPHLPPSIRQWLGDSRGSWDGDTLVVESVNFTDKTGSFNTLSHALGSGTTLRLVERLTRVDATTLLYEFTVDDPVTFTRPFSAAIPMQRGTQPLFEYACHEGNYAITNSLAGARATERDTDSGGAAR